MLRVDNAKIQKTLSVYDIRGAALCAGTAESSVVIHQSVKIG